MPSTSISQPPVRRSPANRHYGPSQFRIAQPRPAHAGPGGLARRRAQLEERWRDRLERVTALSLAYHDEGDLAALGLAGAAESRRARMLARQAVAERQALAEIEAALDRIASGRYGWCEQCGRPIAAALLAAQPQVRFCAACAGGVVTADRLRVRTAPRRRAHPGRHGRMGAGDRRRDSGSRRDGVTA